MNRCSVCSTDADGRYCSRPILAVVPDGKCDYLFLGAGPGEMEAKTNEPYTGLAGDELTGLYLPLASLKREHVAIGNATLCWDGTDRTPPVKRVLGCAREHLASLLERVQPVVVVLMGGVTQSLCDKRIWLDVHHGIPQYTTLLDGMWEGWIWPTYEPALGMRDTRMMTPLMEDFKRLGEWMRGEWTPPTSDEIELDYRTETVYIPHYPTICAIDTERHGDEMWSLQMSSIEGKAEMLRHPITSLRYCLNDHLEHTEVALHNAPQDLDALDKMGVHVERFRDTMQEAYQLCYLPQGLKALVYRLFGHEMKSWEDVVWPASVAKVKEWLESGIALAATQQNVTVTSLKMGKCRSCGKRNKWEPCNVCGGVIDFNKIEYSPSALESILVHILRHTAETEDNEKPYDPWKMLPKMRRDGLRGKVVGEKEWERLIGEVGEMPVLGIGNVSEDEAVAYACADADYTLRLARKLEELRNDKRWEVDEADWDD